jgi:hypothetical protein
MPYKTRDRTLTLGEPEALNRSMGAMRHYVCLLKIPHRTQRYAAISVSAHKHIARSADRHCFHPDKNQGSELVSVWRRV